MSEHTISLVDGDKCDSVVALFEAQLLEHDIVPGRDDLESAIRTVVDEPRYGFMLVANGLDGQTVGVAYASCLLSLEHGGISGWLEELYVLPQWRNLGIGSQLIRAAISHARELGWRAIDLEVESSHQRAISLYARHQFRPLSRTRYVRPLSDET
jgi:ribosomal protein S18 acetylase RimI-like enzyme